eukprot:m.35306 g.35306  ORF g.35306 m.35306 type:complete len:278 (-) comp12381_c0_seq1:133-966(-)
MSDTEEVVENDVVDTTLRPKLVNIGRRQYRTTFPDDGVAIDSSNGEATADVASSAHEFEQLEDGRYRFAMTISSLFYGLIIGRGGQAKTQLEKETNTIIQVPDRRSRSESVVISASSPDSLEACRTRLELLVGEGKAKARPTHFVCFPLNSKAVQKAAADFHANTVDLIGQQPDFHESWIIDPISFHLTIGVLKLFTAAEIVQATEVLKEAQKRVQKLFGGQAQECSIQGLGIMNEDHKKVQVFPHGHCLWKICACPLPLEDVRVPVCVSVCVKVSI